MRPPEPSPQALQAARDCLHALSSTRQTYHLYDPGHPNRREATRVLLEQVHELQRRLGADPVLFVTRHSFYLGATLLPHESLRLFRLLEAFERAGVVSVELHAGADADGLDGLVRILTEELPTTSELVGITLNRLQPQVNLSEDEDLTELRRGYALGLALLRESAARAAAGRPIDLQEATEVVEQLAIQVVRDPSQALLLAGVRSYHEYTYHHMVNVCLLTIALGHAVGLRRDQVVVLGIGALLHDVGKLNVPQDVLDHVGPLSEEQWRIVQRHPIVGAGLVFGTRDGLYHPAAPAVLEHHAAYDLSGYPELTGRPLPCLPARVIAVADCFDAVTSKRSYRKPEERRQALQILASAAGTTFDPQVVRVFLRLLGLFPVGSLVQLRTGEIALVVATGEDMLAAPTVRLVLDPSGNPCEPRQLDLSVEGAPAVVRSVPPDDLDLDLVQLLITGRVQPADPAHAGGLVHEPSPGEPPPPGYVDTHRDAHGHQSIDGAPDPDVAAPWREP
ncbi:MAG: HD-GYP domain-containing protein [Actinomycetota bacterium]|nr:HD-GYP domain-containing protein [Actinomycetota bacterium]